MNRAPLCALRLHCRSILWLAAILLAVGLTTQVAAAPMQQPAPPVDPAARQAAQLAALDAEVDALYDAGDVTGALAVAEQGAALARRLGDRQSEGEFLYDVGYFHHDLRRFDEALNYYARALAIQEELGNVRAQGDILSSMGAAHGGLGDFDAARQALEAALPLVLEAGNANSIQVTYGSLAAIYNRLGQPASALSSHELYLAYVRESGDRTQESTALTSICLFYRDAARYTEALEHCEQALALQQELGAQQTMAYTWVNLGIIYGELGRGADSLAAYATALAAFRALGNVYGEGMALINRGIMLDELARYPEALATYDEAAVVFRRAGNPSGEALAINNAGLAYRAWGRYTEALAAHQEALALLEGTGDVAEQNATLNDIGNVYAALGRQQEALDTFARALASQREMGDQRGVEGTLGNISLIYRNLGRLGEALAGYQEVLASAERRGDTRQQARTLTNIAQIQEELGRYEDALRSAQLALDLQAVSGDRQGEQNTRMAIAAVYRILGDTARALAYVQQAIDIAHESGDRESEIGNLFNLGLIYQGDLQRYDEALASFERALEVAELVQSDKWQMRLLNTIGGLHTDAGRHVEGAVALNEAVTLARERGDTGFAIISLTALTNASLAQAQNEEAFAYAQQALDAAAAAEDPMYRWIALANVAGVHGRQQEYEQALAAYEEALDLLQSRGDWGNAASILRIMGNLYAEQDESEDAIAAYTAAIDLLESVQGEIQVDELQSGFAATYDEYYAELIDLLWQTGRLEESFDYAERARARSFLNQLGNQPINARRGAASALIKQEEALRQQITGLQSALAAERAKSLDEQSAELLAAIGSELETARTQHAELLVRLKLANPAYAALVSISTLSIAEVQADVLDGQTTLVEYFVGEEHTLAWVVDRATFAVVELPIGRDDLAAQVQYVRDLVASREYDYEVAAELYAALIAPLTPHIRRPNLLIAPHGPLHYLPFAALWDAQSERFLVERYALTYTPSASALAYIGSDAPPVTGGGLTNLAGSSLRSSQAASSGSKPSGALPILAFGNPDGTLAHAEQEASYVAQLYGTHPRLRGEASESRFYREAGDAGLIHLAAHGVYNPYNPLYTRIELAAGGGDDGYLEVHELFGLALENADLVVLSACESALGRQSDGDEITGLPRAFLYAGAPAVVTTLWRIDDVSSAELMAAFYRHLRAGETASGSLAAAQREIAASAEWGEPYYWAAFTVTGAP